VSALEPPEEHFANFFEVGFTKTLLVLDFSQAEGDAEDCPVHKTRITIEPQNAVILVDLLRMVTRQYSERFPGSGISID
jgi:hypothetical protein